MYGKLNKNIGFSLIVFAFFFLFEPNYGLIDPLPDIIGYSILCLSLINLADINDKVNTAFKAFRKCIIINVLKLASWFFIRRVFEGDEQMVGTLLFIFIFAAFDIFFAIPGYKALFDGLLSLAIFEGGEAVYFKKRQKGRNITEKIYSLTVIFLILKNTVCALPDFTTLINDSSYEFINIVRLLAIAILTPISVVWLVKIISYFVNIRNDTAFIGALSKKFTDKANAAPDYFTGRVLRVGLVAIMIALLLSFDIYSENVNILPDIFLYGLLIISALFLRRFSSKWVGITLFSVLGAILSLLFCKAESRFFSRYDIIAIKKDYDAYVHYYHMLGLSIAQAIVFIVVFVFVLLFLADIFNIYIKKSESEHDIYIKEQKIGFNIRLCICAVTSVFSALGTVYYTVALPRFEYSWIYYYSGTISGTLSVIFIASACALILYMIGETNNKYKQHL